MTDVDDPRRSAFATVPVRPNAEPELRGVVGPPPPKPPAAVPDDDDPGSPGRVPAEEIGSESSPTVPPAAPPPPTTRTAGRPGTKGRAPKADDGSRPHIGTRRGNLVYVQTQITPVLSTRLDETAAEQDVVLGEVLMAAVRAFRPTGPGVGLRRPRRGVNRVRRDIGILPAEADELLKASSSAALTVSAFLRQALTEYL